MVIYRLDGDKFRAEKGNQDYSDEGRIRNLMEAAEIAAEVDYLYLMAGISDPTEQENEWAMEAIIYANPDLWVQKPYTVKEYTDRKTFEIKSFSYFMRKRNYNDIKAIKYFDEYEHRELTNLRAVTLRPAFNCG